MVILYKKSPSVNQSVKRGGGLINNLIDSLPVELHLPGGYQFCGPGTKLEQRLSRGDKGINGLDAACREHDIAYSKSKDLSERHKADKILADKAWQRFKSKDNSISERTNAYIVTNAMKVKRKFGMGMSKKQLTLHKKQKMNKNIKKNGKHKTKKAACGRALFKKAVGSARKMLNKVKPDNIESAIQIADKTVKKIFKKEKLSPLDARVIPIPKVGGFLSLIPVLTALGAIGGLASGGSSIMRAVNEAKVAKEQLDEAQRHNKSMESIAIGSGKGLFLKPYRKGYGLYYKPYNKSSKNS